MKKIVLMLGLLLTATACSRTTTVQPPASATASSPRAALDAFLGAVKAQDLQSMSAAWGDKDGSVRSSDKIGRDELERRELIMMCYFKHDSYKVLGERPAAGGERVMEVALTRGTLSRTTNFYLANDGHRWFVRTADMESVRDLCKK